MLPYSDACVQLVKDSEGFSPYPAPDPVGIGTVCWGHKVMPGEHYAGAQTEDQCEPILRTDLGIAWACVAANVTTTLGQGQVDSCTDFVFNEGAGNFERSTLLKLINSDQLEQAANEFLKWDLSGGKVLQGLITRRQKEQALFMSDFPDVDQTNTLPS